MPHSIILVCGNVQFVLTAQKGSLFLISSLSVDQFERLPLKKENSRSSCLDDNGKHVSALFYR